MALNPSSLTKQILELVFTKRDGDNYVEPSKRFARCYRNYAGGARSCQNVPPLAAALDAAEIKLAALLAAQLPRSRNPQSFARIYATGLAAFWMLPPVPFVGGPSAGAVTIAIPTTLEAALLGIVVQGIRRGAKNTPQLAAADWGRALDTWTRTVVAAHGPVPACVAPLV